MKSVREGRKVRRVEKGRQIARVDKLRRRRSDESSSAELSASCPMFIYIRRRLADILTYGDSRFCRCDDDAIFCVLFIFNASFFFHTLQALRKTKYMFIENKRVFSFTPRNGVAEARV